MPASRPLGPTDPATIASYRLTGRIGEGGQGVVYAAEDGNGRRVAVKLLHRRFSQDEQTRRSFGVELRRAQRVTGPRVARILAYGVHDGRLYYAGELVDGSSLWEVVERQGPRSGDHLHEIAVGTLTALTAIHQAGMAHGDFGPSSVLLGGQGPQVIDFAVGRLLDGALSAGALAAASPFSAPEHLAAAIPGPESDMFAWGSTIVYAATGRAPFGQDSVPAVVNRILNGMPDLSALSGPLLEAVTACLDRVPSRRPAARDLLARLEGVRPGPGPAAAAEPVFLMPDRNAPAGPPEAAYQGPIPLSPRPLPPLSSASAPAPPPAADDTRAWPPAAPAQGGSAPPGPAGGPERSGAGEPGRAPAGAPAAPEPEGEAAGHVRRRRHTGNTEWSTRRLVVLVAGGLAVAAVVAVVAVATGHGPGRPVPGAALPPPVAPPPVLDTPSPSASSPPVTEPTPVPSPTRATPTPSPKPRPVTPGPSAHPVKPLLRVSPAHIRVTSDYISYVNIKLRAPGGAVRWRATMTEGGLLSSTSGRIRAGGSATITAYGPPYCTTSKVRFSSNGGSRTVTIIWGGVIC
ncbi:hypothetical protein Sme01_30440 [Sphaerisporangium melleum]|uniref:Protein kinase domain-containing protein n=1 Tax=Sphaerisporangium melleum TaxID=321316 RepID=A0A917VUU5_9ACTN|nr:serine/threonine-protein kinase [Sphaerisporangium melleum]GGL16176.1 hypothetical protein GCM10007964_67710 [Sphaerisporangium melleum]GII70568.1 hypothetical protein Sme01_30440 [Sphaerisporangium melleum]